MRTISQMFSLFSSIIFFCGVFAPTFSTVTLNMASLHSVAPSAMNSRKTDAAVTSPYSVSYPKSSGDIGSSRVGIESNQKMTSKIHSSLRSPNEGASVTNGFSDLANTLIDEQDKLDNADQNTKEIYDGVVGLLALKMQTWLASKEKNMDSISQYLGYPVNVVHVINSSITELLVQQHKKKIDPPILLETFYYSCDIKSLFEDDINKVTDKFKGFLRKFGFPKQIKNDKVDHVETETNRIVDTLTKIVPNGNPAVNVSISSMKNKQMIDESSNEQIEKLKERFVENYGTISELAKYYAQETIGEKVSDNHATILSTLASDILGYAYNHVELLEGIANLGTEGNISDVQTNSIDRIHFFFDGFANVFINRIFYFKTNGEMNQTVLNDLFSVIDFFKRESDDTVDNGNLTIDDFYKHPQKRAEIINHIRSLLNKLLEDLLKVSGSNESIEQWKERCTVELKYPEGLEKNTNYFVSMIEGNITDAIDLMGTYTADYDYSVNRYLENGFNIAEWPEYIF